MFPSAWLPTMFMNCHHCITLNLSCNRCLKCAWCNCKLPLNSGAALLYFFFFVNLDDLPPAKFCTEGEKGLRWEVWVMGFIYWMGHKIIAVTDFIFFNVRCALFRFSNHTFYSINSLVILSSIRCQLYCNLLTKSDICINMFLAANNFKAPKYVKAVDCHEVIGL